jgi:hypothetical protein
MEEVPHGCAVVAVVNGNPITFGQVWARVGRRLEHLHGEYLQARMGKDQFQRAARILLESALQDLINRTLLLAKAKEEGIKVTEKHVDLYAEREMEFFNQEGENLTTEQDYWDLVREEMGWSKKEYREELRARVTISQFLHHFVWQPEYFSPEVVRSYYREHQNEYRAGGHVTIRHIYVRREDRDFDRIVEEIKAGLREKGFEAVALEAVRKRWSLRAGNDGAGLYRYHEGGTDEPGAGREATNGPLDMLRDPLPSVIRSLAVGQTSPPIEKPSGVHFVKLLERGGGRVKEFSEVQIAIQRKLARDLERRTQGEYVSKLARTAEIRRFAFPETPLGRITWDEEAEPPPPSRPVTEPPPPEDEDYPPSSSATLRKIR